MKDGNEIPIVGLGTFGMMGDVCEEAVRTAIELGYTLIDTAEVYGNESEIGRAIEGFDRSELFITTKVWPINLHYQDLKESFNRSLKKLGTDYIDLYLIHWPPETVPFNIPLEEPLDAMADLVEEGKVNSIGISNFDIAQIKEAMNSAKAPISANQIEFHPYYYDEGVLNFCKNNDITPISYSPLARTKVFDDETIAKLSDKYDKTPAQITLRWELQKGVVVVPKSRSKAHLEENLNIFDWELEGDDVKKIDNIRKTSHSIGFYDVARATKFSIKELLGSF